ncbi:MAG: ArnT family glycosyltransferase [Neisseriaceae bacterium]
MLSSNKTIVGLIGLSILVGSLGMFFPILGSTFSPYYASIAKHIALSNNWSNLILSGKDWLDKPHFPFWITAICFKIFGVNSFAYILPGFIFNLIGAYYTYKLAKIWCDEKVSLLATLLYLTTLHLMLSAIDVRAEAYLLGEIIPACYYFLLFDHEKKIGNLLFASFFSALAMMTKGIFVMATISSGLISLWIYQKRLKNFIDLRWYLAIVLSFILTFPEVVSLYIQFDMHPEKIIFGVNHVSGIKWFFWDSQFGRFFNTGPIATTNPMPYHWLFFVHTFLWAFLPWWPIFFYALWAIMKRFRACNKSSLNVEQAVNTYLLGSFCITFLLFSATTFQVDHYTNIIFPFACIICARCVSDLSLEVFNINKKRIIAYIEIFLSILFLFIAAMLSFIVFQGNTRILLSILVCVSVITLVLIYKKWSDSNYIIYPVVSILTLFIVIMCVNGIAYAKYDVGYNIATKLNKNVKNGVIVGYKMDDMPLKGLEFYSKNNYIANDNLDQLPQKNTTFYIVTHEDEVKTVQGKFKSSTLYISFSGCSIEKFLANIANKHNLAKQLDRYVVIKVD